MNPRPLRRGLSRTLQYFEGIGIGLLPLALLFLGLRSSGPLGTVGLILYLASFIAAIVCLIFSRVRFVGYGLLTIVVISPPIAFQVACTVSLQGHI